MQMGFDNDNVKSSNFEKFKGEKGKKYRIGFVSSDPKKVLSGAQQHYFEKPFLCKSKEGSPEICCTHAYAGNTAKWKIGGAIIVYTLGRNSEGKASWGPTVGDYALQPWIFNDKIYSQLKTMDGEWGLADHDIQIECTDSKYQSFTLSIAKESLWNRETTDDMKKFRAKILAEAAKVSKTIPRNLGQDLGLSEIRELIGLDTVGAGDSAEDLDMSDIADDLG